MKKHKKTLMRLIPFVIVIALTIGLSALFYQNLVDETTDNCWNEMATAHREMSGEIALRFNSNLKILNLAADAIMINADLDDHDTVLEYLSKVQHDTIFDRVDVVFPNGTILVQNGDIVEDNGEKTYDELIAKGSHISQRVADFVDKDREVIHFLAPVYDANDQPVAILGASIYCSTLKNLFISAHYGEDAQLFLVDMRDGKIVLDEREGKPGSIYDMKAYAAPSNSKAEDPIADMLAGNTGTMQYTSKQSEKATYTYYAPVNDFFSLVMIIQEEVVFSALNDMTDTLSWVIVIEFALLLLFIIWTYNIIRRSLEYETRADNAELELLRKKEHQLQTQYNIAANRQEFLELMAKNLPGGYHRCTTDYSFRLTFISNSFIQVTGYTLEQINEEFNGSYMGIVAPEDREYFMSLAPDLERDGYIHCAYRICRRDGELRWVKDTTQYVEHDGDKYYQCALMDITEQIEEINRSKQAAEESSQAKSTFLFNISHDLRTPMNAIKGFSRIIEENANDPELVAKTVGKINKASDSLMMLMNDVLDISRIERGKEELNLSSVYLYDHGKNLYEMFVADMEAAGINFVVGGERVNDHIYCDELKLTRIIMNMLSNARKFTPAGGTVTFGCNVIGRDERTCTYRFFVKDTGVGMSAEFQKRAFGQFERERTTTESGVTGSGLGLAIIKMLAELMDGTVELESELGKGTEISVILTFALADEEKAHQEQDIIQNKLDMSGKRILLVEDNEFNREIAKYILEEMNLHVDEAENGAVCIDKLLSAGAGYYDLVLMDIQMPVMDGYTATVEIRNLADKAIADIPIVAMTANAFNEDKQKCLEAGMNGHIGKPVEPTDLIAVLLRTFKK